jgi:hypothetical protein
MADKMNSIFESQYFISTVHMPKKTIYQSRPKAESILFSPLHCRGDYKDTRYENMQNKPNFKLTLNPTWFMGTPNAHIPAAPHGSRATSHESRFMKNEPNLNISATKIYLDLASWLRCLLQLFTSPRLTFAHKLKKMRAFCKFLKITYLTTCTTKTYITLTGS